LPLFIYLFSLLFDFFRPGVDQAAATGFLAQARRRRRLFAGIETQTQLAYAVMDQRLFGPENAAERFGRRFFGEDIAVSSGKLRVFSGNCGFFRNIAGF
jgi:hypothetical protein